MSHFIIKCVPHLSHSTIRHSKFQRLFSLKTEAGKPLSQNANHRSCTVKYFMDKWGFSKYKASKYVNFSKPDETDACLAFLKNHAFTHTQLFKLLRKCPRIIASDPQKTLLPKIQFLHSRGFLETDIAALLVEEPNIFQRSLEGHLVPTFNLLKDHLGSVETTIQTIKLHPKILSCYQIHVLRHNIQLLKEAGVPRRCTGKPLSHKANHHSFTVNYFINKCGFSRYKAVLASKYVSFDKPDKPDAFLSFFKNRGFTDVQLSNLLTKCPTLIASDIERTLLSTFDLLKDHLGSVEDTVKTIESYPKILLVSQTCVLQHNIQLLKEVGVTSRCIASALRTQPLVFRCPCDKMKEVVEGIKKMGVDPRSWKFMAGVCLMGSLTKLGWKNKLEVYHRWGCSEEEVLKAFKRVPRCMKVSEEKVDGLMDFFVNEMGWSPQMLLLTPQLFRYSLQKKIVPRCSVYKVLLSKGLLKVKGSLYTVVKSSEDKFLDKYINCYPEEAPELLRLYEETMKHSVNRYNSEDEFLEKFINCQPEETPELFKVYEEKIKKSMSRYKA